MTRPLNLLLYQVGWFACVLGAALSRPWLGIGIAAALVGVHLLLARDRRTQIKILAIALAIGLFVDAALLNLGVYKFPSGMYIVWLPPLWMSVLWIQFATTLRYGLSWLGGRYILSALFGLAGAPLAFLAGEKIGAVLFLPPRIPHLLALGTLWCVAIPLLIYITDRVGADSGELPNYRGFEPRVGYKS
jgi:hypothetical protein